MILYLHGFRSSPHSFKARLLAQHLQALGRADDYVCPQLPASPQAAMQQIDVLVQGVAPDQLSVIGSSLGGFYATWLAEQTGCRAVLLNPAVKPPRDLAPHVGVSSAYHDASPFEFKHEYIDQLQSYTVPAITRAQRYFLIAASGDEVLDWREMTAHYAGARQHVIDGSDHGLSDFAQYVESVLAFCDGAPEVPI